MMRIAMLLALGAVFGGCVAAEEEPACMPPLNGVSAWEPVCGDGAEFAAVLESGNAHIAVCGDAWSASCGRSGISVHGWPYCSEAAPDAVTCAPGEAASCVIIPCDGEWYGPGVE